MVNKRERQILNKASTTASQESYQVRNSEIDSLEMLREALGLNMNEIDSVLGESRSWYSNHQRGGGTHEFTRPDYFRLNDMLEMEYLRDLVSITKNEVSRSLNNSRGWYEDQLRDGFKINDYNRIKVFLLTAAVLQNQESVLGDSELSALVDLDIVDDHLIEDLQDSVEIDYGH